MSKRGWKAEEKVPETLKLSELEMLKLGKANAEARAIRSEIALFQNERLTLLARIDPQNVLGRIDAAIANVRAERDSVFAEQASVRAAIEQRLCIVLSEYAYDDVTGTLTNLLEVPTKE